MLHPERIIDYPSRDLPDEVWDALEHRFDHLEEETGWSYEYELSVSTGVKVGGYPTWTQSPDWPDCPRCGHRMEHLLTINSMEFDGSERAWLPIEDRPATGAVRDLPQDELAKVTNPHGLSLGDGGGLYLFDCRRCPYNPYTFRYDCS